MILSDGILISNILMDPVTIISQHGSLKIVAKVFGGRFHLLGSMFKGSTLPLQFYNYNITSLIM